MTEDKRIVSGENLDASEQADLTLRPKTLKTYIGQEKSNANFPFILQQRNNGKNRLTMFFYTVLPA